MPKTYGFDIAMERLRQGLRVRPVDSHRQDLYITLCCEEHRLDLYHGDALVYQNVAPNWDLLDGQWEDCQDPPCRHRYEVGTSVCLLCGDRSSYL